MTGLEQSVKYWVDDRVLDYIQAHGLYTPGGRHE